MTTHFSMGLVSHDGGREAEYMGNSYSTGIDRSDDPKSMEAGSSKG